MYVQSNTEARSRNHCCSGKTIRITYSERKRDRKREYMVLVTQHAERMRRYYTVLCGLSGSTTFLYINP
jgi:hypothetical protein